MRLRFLGALASVGFLVLAGCDNKPSGEPPSAPAPTQATTPAPALPAPAPAPVTVAPPMAPPPAAIALGTSQAVYTVDSLVVSHPDDAPTVIVILATGSVRTGGWTAPKLEEMPDTGDATVKSYRFVATSPTDAATVQALQVVEAELRLDSLPPKVTTIRVVSETNEISAAVQ